MATNPIQRRTRNSFLLGMLVMLLVAAVAIALLYLTLFKGNIGSVSSKGDRKIVKAYRLTQVIESGEQISNAKIELAEFYSDTLPVDAINNPAVVNFRSKVTLQPGTVLTKSLIYEESAKNVNSTRLVEYNMITLPSKLKVGDFVDVRFTVPSGQDYIVVSKKQVMNLQDTTVSFYLTEDEILMMSSAIIESYIMNASDLHIVQYVEAGVQPAAVPTYSINADVFRLIQEKQVNIDDYTKINGSYSEELRATIQKELDQYQETGLENIEEGIKEQKETAKSLYLSGLSGN